MSTSKGKEEQTSTTPVDPRAEFTIDLTDNPDDRISVAENEALQKLKQLPIAQGLDDKFLMIFLFARKLNIERTVQLLEGHFKWRKENGYERLPERNEVSDALCKTYYSFHVPGKHDKEDRLVTYLLVANFKMKEYTLKELLDHMMYVFNISLKEPLRFHRKGYTYIEDVKGFSFKNYDSNKGKAMNEGLQSNFPVRVSLILVVNAGAFIKILLGFARFLGIKKKIISRTFALNINEIPKYVDKDNLIQHFGGNLPNPWDVEH